MGVQLPPLAPSFILIFLFPLLSLNAYGCDYQANESGWVRPPNAERRGSPKTDSQDISKRNTIINPAAGNFMLPETAQGLYLKYSLLTTCRTPVLALRIKRNSRRIDSMENTISNPTLFSLDYFIRSHQHVWRNRLSILDFGFSIVDSKFIG